MARRARRLLPACGKQPNASATRSSSSRSTAPVRRTPTALRFAPRSLRRSYRCCGTSRGQRRGVHRRRGVHLRHGVCGRTILYENIMWYRPRPLLMKQHEWISPVTIALRDLDGPWTCQGGRRWAGRCCTRWASATGFTHMEWYRKADGEAVFGEIGGAATRRPYGRPHELRHRRRPVRRGGPRLSCTEAVSTARAPTTTPACIFKRAKGAGSITGVEGLDKLMAEYGEHVALVDLLPIGAPRRDWRAVISPTEWSSCATPNCSRSSK